MNFKKIGYKAPFVLMVVLGVFFTVQYYVPHPVFQQPASLIKQWKQPLNAIITFTALFGLAWFHVGKVRKMERRWGYSLVTLLSMGAMIFVGLYFGKGDDTIFATWYRYLITPLEATVFSLLAFYIASAAFRAFRARTTGATVLLISAFVVMLGLIPAVENIFPALSDFSAFLLKYPNTAAKRAIMIGVALGAISVAVKTIFGIDRSILGKER